MIENYTVELDVLTPVIINNGEYYQFGELLPSDKTVVIKDRDDSLPLPVIRKFYLNDMTDAFGCMSATEITKFINRMTVAIAKRDEPVLIECRSRIIKESGVNGKMPIRVLKKAYRDLSAKPLQSVTKIASSPIDGKTYIPGSSIKGALRTGVLEGLRKSRNIDHWSSLTDGTPSFMRGNLPNQRKMKDAQNFEMEVMKNRPQNFNILDDPFKYLRISDFSFFGTDAITYISKVGDDDKMPIYSAATSSYAFSGRHVTAKGTVSVDSRFYSGIGMGENTGFQKILDLAGDFYIDNMDSILHEVDTPLMKYVYNKIYAPMAREGQNMIRLGHYSGIKNCTFNVNQLNPPRSAAPAINIKGGRTVKLEEGVIPGMCMIRIVRG